MAKAQKVKRKKGQRKKFFEVKVPLTATKVHLYAYSPEDLVGKTIKLDLTKSLRGKNAQFRVKVRQEGDELVGQLHNFMMLPSYLKKVTRRGTDYVEDSFEAECKDAVLRIKPFMITRKRVSRAVRKTIREAARKFLEARARIRTAQELFSEIVTNKLQKELSLKIKKIYPLSLCEIRMLNVESYKKPEEKKAPEKKTAAKTGK